MENVLILPEIQIVPFGMAKNLLNKGILLTMVIITSVFLIASGNRVKGFYGDALGYYLYLPSTFIYHNLQSPDKLPADKLIQPGIFEYTASMVANKSPKGNIVDQYTYGVALMESPFFFMAHLWEKANNLHANGYSENYYSLIKLSSLFYALVGLVLVYQTLKNYFSPTLSLLTTAIIFLGTNLLWFSVYQPGMSHTPLFFLYALLIFLVIRLHQKPMPLLFTAAGITAGLITIIRPTDVLCLLIPLLYNVYGKDTLHQKIVFIKDNLFKVCLFAFAFILPIIPQLLYWKAMAGSYIFYSYGQQGFKWRHPKIIEGLFYFNNGWLPYSPVMIFSLLGLLFLKPLAKWKWCMLAILPAYIYVIYSWYCYNYINGLGSRPMVNVYPLLALPLAAFIYAINRQKWMIKYAFGTLCIFFMAVNICYSMQQAAGLLWSEESNGPFNIQMLFRMHLKYNDMVVNDLAEWQPDSSKLTKVCTIACQDFDDSISGHYIRDTIFGSKYLYRTMNEEISMAIASKWDKQKFAGAKWIKCSGKFMYSDWPQYYKHLLVLDIDNLLWKGCKIENKILGKAATDTNKDLTLFYSQPGIWGYVSFFTKVPKNIPDGTTIKVFTWDMAKTNLYMDDLCIELYK